MSDLKDFGEVSIDFFYDYIEKNNFKTISGEWFHYFYLQNKNNEKWLI